MGPELLRYRPWRGSFRGPAWSVWPIARVGLTILFRRKLFWGLYGLSLLFFLMFFFGQYLLAYAESEELPQGLVRVFRQAMRLDGSALVYRNFFRLQGSMVVIVLALGGSVLVGNDFQYGSLPFYLSKPLGPWQYLGGKLLATAIFVHLMTTVPAVVLFVQRGLLTDEPYFWEGSTLLGGIVVYGLILSVCLSLLLVAMASGLRQTVPLLMGWTTLFFFCRILAGGLVGWLNLDPRWRLIDLWNNTWLVGNALLGVIPYDPERDRVRAISQPDVREAAWVLAGVCLVCLIYLNRRIRAVEIVR